MQTADSERMYTISFYAALCLFLSAVEYAVPKPFPFMRLGLANLPVLLSLSKMRKRDTLLLVLLKIAGQSLISGTVFSYVTAFSAAGSLASCFVMMILYAACYRRNAVSYAGLSIAGALANNLAQIGMAHLMVFGANTKYIAPVLLVSGLVTGTALGMFAQLFSERSSWYAGSTGYTAGACENTVSQSGMTAETGTATLNKRCLAEFIIGMMLFPVFLLQKNTAVVWIFTAVFYGMAMIRKRGRVRIISSVLMTVAVTFFALLSPYGKIIVSIGKFHVTYDALLSGLHKSGILTGMVFLSQFAVSSRMAIPGKAGLFLHRMMSVFDALGSERITFTRGHVIEAIDARLEKIWTEYV
jgi:uncharacterized membrane protein